MQIDPNLASININLRSVTILVWLGSSLIAWISGVSENASAQSMIASTPLSGSQVSGSQVSSNSTNSASIGKQNVAGPAGREMIDPNLLVFYALKSSIAGSKISYKVHQLTNAYNQQVILSGEYKSTGNWTGQFRYTARVSAGETTMDVIQIPDGRLMYTQFGADSPPKLVNVEKVREQLIPRIYRPEENQDVYVLLAIGGQAELMRSLYQRYNWHRAEEGKIGGLDVWQLFGKLRTEPPKHMGTAEIDQQLVAMNPDTENLPSHVRLTLGRPVAGQNETSIPYFPYQIEYFRLEKNEKGHAVRLAPLSKIEYLEPTRNFKESESDFIYRVEPTIERIDEETSRYVPRIQP
ncbi:MAG: hypothetical protein ACK5T6_19260 [Pirellula sp.]